MKFLLLLFTTLGFALQVQGQSDIPLETTEYTTLYRNDSLITEKYISVKTYKGPRATRYEEFNEKGEMELWFETHLDGEGNEVIEIWWESPNIYDTLWTYYGDNGKLYEIQYWGEEKTHDTTFTMYNADGLAVYEEKRYGFGIYRDSLFYEDSLVVKIVSYDMSDGEVGGYETLRYNRKGLIYIHTDYDAKGEVDERNTYIYNSNRDIKEHHWQYYSYFNDASRNIDRAYFYKFDPDFNKVKGKSYDYVKKIKRTTKYTNDGQGRCIRMVTKCKKEGTKEIKEIVYE